MYFISLGYADKPTPFLKLYRRTISQLFTCSVSLSILLIASGASFAQSAEDEDLLPDIDPQDIEIRGDFTAEFQGLTRQPILGFTPEPRVFQIDPDRMPFIEDEEDVVATISVSDLEEPLSPDAQLIGFPDKGSTFLRAGYGIYDTPYGRLFTEQQITSSTKLRADSRFSSSAGHDLDHPTSFRSMNLNADVTHREDRDRIQAGISGYSHFNYTGDATHPVYLQDTPPRSESGKFEASLDWQRLYNPYNGWQIHGDIRNTSLTIDKFTIADFDHHESERRDFGEQALSLHVHRFFEGQVVEEQFLIEGGSEIGLFNNGIDDQNWNFGWLGFSYSRRFAQVHRVSGGVRAYQTYDPFDDLNFRFYPDFQYSYNPGTRWNLKLHARGEVKNPGLTMIPETNRTTVNVPILRNQRGWDLSGSTSYSWDGGNKIYTNISYQAYDGYPYFRYTPHMSGHQLDFVNSASILQGTVGYATDIAPRVLSLRTEFTARSTSANGLDRLPYYEPLSARAELYSNPIDNFYLQTALDIRSSRPVQNSDSDISGFVLASVQAEYKLAQWLGIYVQGLNLFNQNYELWQGYEERPLQVLGGLTIRF